MSELETVFDTKRGYMRLAHLPTAEALARFYAKDFWQSEKQGEYDVRMAQREWWEAHYGDWLDLVEKHSEATKHGNKLLDVGCGFGEFLRVACSGGWYAWGVEPNDFAREKAREFAVVYSVGSEDIVPDANTWDLVSALWVLEHLLEPEVFLTWAHKSLKPKGALLLAVPNDFSALQLSANERGWAKAPRWWVHHTHLNYWTPVTLANLLGRCGFRVAAQTTMYPMEAFLMSGMDYTANAELGQTLHAKVRKFDLGKSAEARRKFYREMAERGQGRELIVVATKV